VLQDSLYAVFICLRIVIVLVFFFFDILYFDRCLRAGWDLIRHIDTVRLVIAQHCWQSLASRSKDCDKLVKLGRAHEAL